MHADKAQLLINALTSGEYSQTKRALRTQEGFCCLGVACDLYHKATGKGRWGENGISRHVIPFVYDEKANENLIGGSAVGVMPPEVQEWFGFSGRVGGSFVYGLHGNQTLPALNDTFGLSFAKIAEVIKANVDKL